MARNGPIRWACHFGNLLVERGLCHDARKPAVGAKFAPVATSDSRENDLLQTLLLIFRKRIFAEMLMKSSL